MKPTTQAEEARNSLAESVDKMEDWDAKIQALPADADEKEVEFHRSAFEAAKRETARWQDTVTRLDEIDRARGSITIQPADEERKLPAGYTQVGDELSEKTYSQRTALTGRSFFIDLVQATRGDMEARVRLERHTHEVAVERRDLSTTVTAGGNFVPPAYLGELYADLPRPGRQFADAIGSRPLQSTGMNLTIPRITTGTSEALQAGDNAAVAEVDVVEALLTVPVRTIAGQQDVSQQLFDRSEPGIDQILFSDLRRAYDAALDNNLLNGTGANNHVGIRSVATVNAVTYTDASPTAAELVPKIYDAIQQIESNRYTQADMIIMHPRRSAWLASNLSATFPLFQLGTLTQATGTQDMGMSTSLSGLKIVRDANVRTQDGASTNQDEIYVVSSADLMLFEGPLQARVLSDVGSGTLTVRLQLFGYSAFASGRQPKAISIISGTGLVVPTF
jgi:HK97 family phage major capsid protein